MLQRRPAQLLYSPSNGGVPPFDDFDHLNLNYPGVEGPITIDPLDVEEGKAMETVEEAVEVPTGQVQETPVFSGEALPLQNSCGPPRNSSLASFCTPGAAGQRTPKIIAVEGPLGVGKTSLLKSITSWTLFFHGRRLKVVHISEAMDLWCNFYGENMLQRSIEAKDNLLEFQTLVLCTYGEELQKALRDSPDIIILERSPLSSLEVFSFMAYRDGKLSFIQYQLLRRAHALLTPQRLTHIVGLWPPPTALRDAGDLERFFMTTDARVRARDGDTCNSAWNKKVLMQYQEFFEVRLPYLGIEYSLLDPLAPPEKLRAEFFYIIARLFAS